MELKQWWIGTLKSWTAWFGALLIGFPEIWPLIAPHVQEMLSPESYKRLLQFIGIAVILLRFKTKSSVAEKASPPAAGFVRIDLLLLVAAFSVLAACTGAQQRDLYADVEIGVKNGFEWVADMSRQELASRDACATAADLLVKMQPIPASTEKACKPTGTFMTRARADKANDTLGAVKTAARLASDTTGGCVQPVNAEGASALEKLGLAGCLTSDQVLIAALSAIRLMRENLEE